MNLPEITTKLQDHAQEAMKILEDIIGDSKVDVVVRAKANVAMRHLDFGLNGNVSSGALMASVVDAYQKLVSAMECQARKGGDAQ